MSELIDTGRRTFLKVSAALGGGLMLGFYLPGCSREDYPRPENTFTPNAWIQIGFDGGVTFMIERAEMGQGVVTALSMLLAEELEVDLDAIKTEFAVARPEMGATGGSRSIYLAWQPLREAGAAARQMLIRAAAERWQVARSECQARHGEVVHRPSQRALSYGELAAQAATYSVPRDIKLKAPQEYELIGKPTTGIDMLAKIKGEALFGMDVVIPGMKIAVLARPPVFGARVDAFDDSEARQLPGVVAVVSIGSAVAVVADSFPVALQARDRLKVQWRDMDNPMADDQAMRQACQKALAEEGEAVTDRGDARQRLSRAGGKIIDVTYETPLLAHAPMEPMNCTVDLGADRCEIWVPTQNQAKALKVAEEITGLPQRQIRVHPTFIGGGFGRRLKVDYVAEAVRVAQAVKVPVKLMGTMSESIRGGYYRPANMARLRAVMGEGGQVEAVTARFAGPRRALGGVDIPYSIANLYHDQVRQKSSFPTGSLRSVGASQNGFIVESFIDELAHAAGADPLEFRLGLLNEASPRYRGVLETVASKAGWGQPVAGRSQGVALYHSFRSWVAHVVELSVSPAGKIRIHRVVSAIDCGRVVNPDTVKAQVEGAVIFALTAALYGEINLRQGRVLQSNYHDYRLLTLAETPEIEVHIVASDEPPTGVGEPGVPPLAPAVANALFAATGRRIRKLPLAAHFRYP